MHFIPSYSPNKFDIYLEAVKKCVAFGVDTIQFSYRCHDDSELLELGQEVKNITKDKKTKFIVNNRIDIANILEADYLHIGENDIPIEICRKYLDSSIGIGKTITSTGGLHEDADYYGIGPLYKTSTKTVRNTPIGTDTVLEIRAQTNKHLVGIGGVTLENYEYLLSLGLDDCAVIGDIYNNYDILEEILKKYNKIKSKFKVVNL